MRAFMSEPQEWIDEGDDGSRSIFGPLAQMACAEARMILAETEPTSWLFVPGTAEADRGRFVTSRRGSVGWFDETPFDALADALRAFVED